MAASSQYAADQALFDSSPAFVAPLPPWSIPYVSLVLLGAAFLTSFVFTTLPKRGLPVADTATALLASLLFGFGTVATFAWVGVSI